MVGLVLVSDDPQDIDVGRGSKWISIKRHGSVSLEKNMQLDVICQESVPVLAHNDEIFPLSNCE